MVYNSHVMPDALTTVAQSFPLVSIPAKNVVLFPAEHIRDVYFLEAGYVRMYLLSKDGQELTMHVFRPGSYFPLMLILTDSPNKYYFESVTSVSVRKIPKQQLISVLQKNPDVLYDLATRLSGGILGYLVKVESLLLNDAYKRVASILYYFGERFSEKKEDGSVKINMAVTHYLLSTWVGLSRETVSRQIEKLEKKRIIESKDTSITILDMHTLGKELDG